MSKKWLFLGVVFILFCSFNVNAYEFDNKEDFVSFLEEANENKLDLRNNADLSLQVMDYAKEYELDLNYYRNIRLYDSIFSPFSWWITGFAIFSSDNNVMVLDKEEYVVGDTVKMGINQDSVLVDKIVVMIGDKLAVAFPKETGEKTIEFKIPELSPGKYTINIEGTSVSQAITIKEIEAEEDPILVVDKSSIETGDNIIIKGANFPTKESSESLNIFADDILIGVISYPVKGVFEAEAKTSLLKPGSYLVYVEGYETASAKIIVNAPYIEPRIEISDNVFMAGEDIEIIGFNFDDAAKLNIIGDGFIQEITGVVADGNFEKTITAPDTEGEYTIVYSKNPSIFVSFKVVEEEQIQSIYFDDNSVERGTSLVIKGDGFEASKKIVLIREGEKEESIIVSTDASGSFSKSVSTDSYYIGKHKIYSRDNPSVVSYFNIEKEKPVPVINVGDKVYVGENIIVTGSNFYDYERVYIYIDNQKIGYADVNDNSFKYEIGGNFAVGNYKLLIKGNNGEIISSSALNIIQKNNPVLKVVTEQIYEGDSFLVKGFYFNEDVEFYLGDSLVGKTSIDNTGGFSKNIDLGNFDIAPGLYELNARYSGNEDVVAVTAVEILGEEEGEEIIIIDPSEIITGSNFLIQGMGFDEAAESIVLVFDDAKEYVVFPSAGSFELELSSEEFSIGFHKVMADKYDVAKAFTIVEETQPSLYLNESIEVGQELIVSGQNFDNGNKSLLIDGTFVMNVVVKENVFNTEIDTSYFAEGYHVLSVEDVSAGFNLEEKEVMYPGLVLSHSTAGPGLLMGINGNNFPQITTTENLNILLDGVKILEIPYPEDTSFSVSYMILNMENGEHTITVQSHETATAKFIYDSSASAELSMVVYDEEFLPGQEISGVINGMNIGVSRDLDIVINSNPYAKVNSGGLGSVTFSFNIPELPAGNYDVGVAGYATDLTQIEILALPEEQGQSDYTDEEVEALTKEVQQQHLSISDEEVEELADLAQLQNRVLGRVVGSLVSEDCVPNCEVIGYCGQLDGCGDYCSNADINVAGKCGNPLEESKLNQITKEISEPVSNVLTDYVLFID